MAEILGLQCQGFFFSSRRRHTRYIGDWVRRVLFRSRRHSSTSHGLCVRGESERPPAGGADAGLRFYGAVAAALVAIKRGTFKKSANRLAFVSMSARSEERRVGDEWRSR